MPERKINWLSFNEGQDCFVCGLDSGVRVYNTDPLVQKRHISVNELGSVKICTLLHRTNLIAIVGGGPRDKFAENTVLIWDDLRQSLVLEITFSSPVVNVKLSHSKYCAVLGLVVVLKNQVHIFTFPNASRKLGTIETRDNPNGLCQLSCDPENEVLVFPGHKTGSVQVAELKSLAQGTTVSPVTINAHQSNIACIALNNGGSLLATGSTQGTVIRLFDMRDRSCIAEFRRGLDSATLYCISFSSDSAFLCVSSDKGTVHTFGVKDKSGNQKSIFQQVGIVTDEVQRGLTRFSLPNESPAICGFGPGQSVIALCMDGTFHKFVFTLDGNCNREGYDDFLSLGDDCEFWSMKAGQ